MYSHLSQDAAGQDFTQSATASLTGNSHENNDDNTNHVSERNNTNINHRSIYPQVQSDTGSESASKAGRNNNNNDSSSRGRLIKNEDCNDEGEGYPVDEALMPPAVGLNTRSCKRVCLTVPGALRLFENLFALIAFTSMASQDHYTSHSSFSLLVIDTVLAWLFVLILIMASLFDLHSRFSWLFFVEMLLDFAFSFLSMAVGVAVIINCNETVTENQKLCSLGYYKRSKASAVCTMILGVLLAGSLYYSRKRFCRLSRGANFTAI